MNESLKEFFQMENNLFYEFFYHLLNYDTVVNKLIQDFKINECYFYQKLIQTSKDIEIDSIERTDDIVIDENQEQINYINWTSNGIEINYYQILIFFFMKFIQLIKLLFSFITIIP